MMATVCSGSAVSQSWDFGVLLDHLVPHTSSPALNSKEISPAPQCSRHDRGRRLGDFDRLWQLTGKPIIIPSPSTSVSVQRSPQSESSTSATPTDSSCVEDLGTTSASSAPEDDLCSIIRSKRLTKASKSAAARNAHKLREDTASRKRRDIISNILRPIPNDEERSVCRVVRKSLRAPSKEVISSSESDDDENSTQVYRSTRILLQATHTPSTPTRQCSNAISPRYLWTRNGQKDILLRKLSNFFPQTKFSEPLTTTHAAVHGLHIFIDISNIVISFYERLKLERGIHKNEALSGAPFNFEGLAAILERGRPTTRRVIVGSHNASHPYTEPKRAAYLLEAEQCGYEVNLLQRVLKNKPSRFERQQRGSNGNGYATVSGYSSGDEKHQVMSKVMAEQAVDEILHMKLLESLVDARKPSTIVLASGDAAEAEYSGGFMKNVERALSRGWKVEIVAWKNNLSYQYRDPAFLRKWRGKVEIIELDPFLEELLAMFVV